MSTDPYQITDDKVLEPPQSLIQRLKYIGPGFILSASIVGSGELIATTLVGAKAGFVLMWFIIFSCVVKVAVQLEFGKHAIGSGESTMAALNTLPGPRFGKAKWPIWTWLCLMLVKMFQVGGIVGGVVLVFVEIVPALESGPLRVLAAYGVAASVSLFIYRGYYQSIEKAALVMLGAFSVFTLVSLIALQYTELAIQSQELWSGLVPNLPTDRAIIFAAIGAFGITGVGGDEIMAYNYWLIEKGYASYSGRNDGSEAWKRRAQGWIRIMYIDAILAMVAYTAMTVMFYLLGAAVLHRRGLMPDDVNLIKTLGNMYTEALGPWARNMFLIGALVVLYSTLFAALAAWTRLFSDAFGRIGLYTFEDTKARHRAIAIAAWVIPAMWATLFLVVNNPAIMVVIGGIATVVILLIVVFATLYFRYVRLDKRLTSGPLYDAALWTSSIAIFLVAIYVVYRNVYLPAMKLFE